MRLSFPTVLSAIVVCFCMASIALGIKSETAWTMISSIVAYWMPSPALARRRDEE